MLADPAKAHDERARDPVAWLVARGVIDAVGEPIRVSDVSRRNRNHRVDLADGRAVIVKHAIDAYSARALRREAATYLRLAAREAAEGLTVARLLAWDPKRAILALDAIPARTLRDRHGARPLPSATSARLGVALAALHAGPAVGPARRPGALDLDRPTPDLVAEASGLGLELLRRLQAEPGWRDALRRMRAGWRTTAPVHLDLRRENVLEPADPAAPVALIDWELSGCGDPAWDCAWAFSDALDGWLQARPSRPPLASLRPALRAFWIAYAGRAGLVGAPRAAFLRTALRYAGAQLLLVAWESALAFPAGGAGAEARLRAGERLARRPERFARPLLGRAA